MAPGKNRLTLLVRPSEKMPELAGLPDMLRVSDPGPAMPRLRRFFRPWRLFGKLILLAIPCWFVASLAAFGGFLTALISSVSESLSPFAAAGMSTATFFTILPLGILAFWAAVVGVKDLCGLPGRRRRSSAYQAALARLGDADVLTPTDLNSPAIRQGLVTLGQFEKLLHSIGRESSRMSALWLESFYESHRLVLRSVQDLIMTERRIADWSGRLGADSSYAAKLLERRDRLAGSYAGILRACQTAADRALAHATDNPKDLQQSVEDLLGSCKRALAEAEDFGPALDEQELLMHAAKSREAAAQCEPAFESPASQERPHN